MNILLICNKSPYPPKEGGPIAMNTIVEGLIDSGHKIKVLAVNSFKYSVDINSIPDDYKEKTQIEGIFLDLRIKPLDAFLNLFSSKSYHVQRFISKEFEEKIIEILSKNKYDIIQLETLYVTPYIEAIRKHSDAKIVLRAHNIEHLIWDRITQATKNPIKKFYLSHLSKTLKKYELEALDKFDGIAAITKTDADFFKKTGTKTPIVDIPFGINLNKFQLSDGEYEFPSLFHIGSMNWMPNEEGIDWFLNKVWDLIYKKMPDLKIYLAGREMPDWLINYKKTNVEVVGEVENAQDFINSKAIMIVPLFSGSGIRIKIIEGMALGKAIISTRLGAEGIHYEDNKNILIANTPEEFVIQIEKCIKSKELCETIGFYARKIIEEEYDNKMIMKRLVEFFNGIGNEIRN
jgi:polysaccharide biosynthesis protein PslH